MKKGDFCSFPEFGIFKEAVPDDDSNALFAPLGMTVARAVRGGVEEASPLIQSTMSVQKCSSKQKCGSRGVRERQSAFPLLVWCGLLSDCICERPPHWSVRPCG